jgi:predicted amidophosphoribosyltransferase
MHPFLRELLDLFFPPRCQVCRRFAPQPFCSVCLNKVALVQPPLCRHCGLPLDPRATGPEECADCRSTKSSPFTWARSAGLYEGTLRKAILGLRATGDRRALPVLRKALGPRASAGRFGTADDPNSCVTPDLRDAIDDLEEAR